MYLDFKKEDHVPDPVRPPSRVESGTGERVVTKAVILVEVGIKPIRNDSNKAILEALNDLEERRECAAIRARRLPTEGHLQKVQYVKKTSFQARIPCFT